MFIFYVFYVIVVAVMVVRLWTFYVCVISDCVENYGCMFRVLCALRRSCMCVSLYMRVTV
jgi:hypothetical protein